MADIEIKINANFTGGGVAGSFSWQRLEQILRDAGELMDTETIKGYKVDKQGVNYYVEKKGVNHFDFER